MTWTTVADGLAAACLTVGAVLALIAAIGLLRFPDVLTRMHSATKPQVLGLLLILIGLALRLRDPSAFGLLALIGLFQLVTAPVASHMVGRASFRAGQVRRELLVVDELSALTAPDLASRADRPVDERDGLEEPDESGESGPRAREGRDG
jgi:multicomponent Na+:H+ antiporter subunit G